MASEMIYTTGYGSTLHVRGGLQREGRGVMGGGGTLWGVPEPSFQGGEIARGREKCETENMNKLTKLTQ
jgi:hypothetical protein